MPKTTMYENHCSMRREDEIWCTGQITPMYSEAVAKRVHELPD